MKKFRVMVEGEDRMLWCEANNLSEEDADELVEECMTERFENATAWKEEEIQHKFYGPSFYD